MGGNVMQNIKSHTEFTYWKRPWHKWLVLVGPLSQFLCLWMNIQEYNKISSAGILSASEWTSYMAQKNFQCAINGLLAVCFLGIFLIGFSRSKKGVRLIEGLFLVFLALAWGITGFVLHLISLNGTGLLWALILLIAFCGAIHNLLQYRKE